MEFALPIIRTGSCVTARALSADKKLNSADCCRSSPRHLYKLHTSCLQNKHINNQQTFYDVLGVSRSSSSKEIREAYVALTKSLHPDLNPDDPSTHEKFIHLNEAYTVLSKPDSKQKYDLTLNVVVQKSTRPVHQQPDRTAPDDVIYWRDESIWEMRDRSQDRFRKEKPFYGVPGVERVSNLTVAIIVVVITAIGSTMYALMAKISRDKSVKRINAKDQQISGVMKRVQENAKLRGKTNQIHLLKQQVKSN